MGTMEKMKNVTVGPSCSFVIKDSTETKFDLSNVVVQTGGHFAVERTDHKHVTFVGETLDIRGGGKVSIDGFYSVSTRTKATHLSYMKYIRETSSYRLYRTKKLQNVASFSNKIMILLIIPTL